MTHWTPIHAEDRGLFRINVAVAPETDDPNNHFDDDGETAQAIADGHLEWFMACVHVSVAGIPLGEDYIGHCCYERATDFVKAPSDYYEAMIEEAIDEAKGNLAKLAAIYNLNPNLNSNT